MRSSGADMSLLLSMEASVKKVCEDSTCSCTSAQTRTYGELRNQVSVHHSYPKRRTDTGLPAVAGCSLETQSLNVQPLSGDHPGGCNGNGLEIDGRRHPPLSEGFGECDVRQQHGQCRCDIDGS